MWVQCNHPGGVNLAVRDKAGFKQVMLVHGPNKVDEEVYKAALAAADPRWVQAMTEPSKATRIPVLEPCEAPAEEPEDDAQPLNAKDKAALVMAAESFEDLEGLAEGETRKTVLEALDKRTCQLAEAE